MMMMMIRAGVVISLVLISRGRDVASYAWCRVWRDVCAWCTRAEVRLGEGRARRRDDLETRARDGTCARATRGGVRGWNRDASWDRGMGCVHACVWRRRRRRVKVF